MDKDTLASIQNLSMQIHGVLVKKIRENIEEREQAGALVATRCTSIVNCKSPILANSSSNKH